MNRRPLFSPSPPSKRQRLSSPTYEQQVGNLSHEDIDAFDQFELSQSSNPDLNPLGHDPDNPFAAATGFSSASKLPHMSSPDHDRSSSPPPEPDFDAWFAPTGPDVPEMVSFQTAKATVSAPISFAKASGVGFLQPSSISFAKAKEKMDAWKEQDSRPPTVTESQTGAENLFKSASSLPRMASPERPALRALGNATNSPGTPSPAETSRSSSMAAPARFSSPMGPFKAKPFKAPAFVSSPLNPKARLPTATAIPHSLATPIRAGLAPSQRPASASRLPNTKPAFKTPFKAGMRPGESGRALLDKPAIPLVAPINNPTTKTGITPISSSRVVKQFFDLTPPVGRKTLLSSGHAPQAYSAVDFEQYGIIVAELEKITPSVALYYSFHPPTSELLPHTPSTPAKVFDPAAALEELLAQGCSLATKLWVDNHWCLILWKLAGMVCLEPELERDPRTTRWSWEEVMRQLLYRYERELNRGIRPPLRCVATQDAPASCPMVLCVSNISWLDGGVTDDGVPLPAHPELEVTDGWYRLRAHVDAPLARAVRRGVICVGRKIAVVGARLSNERKDPQEVLEAYNSTKLEIAGNGSHLAPWHSKLGFKAAPWVATMRSLTADGGLVPALDVVLLKVYPIAYLEFIEENGEKRREGPRNANEEAQEHEKWKRRREVHESKLREEMAKKELRYQGYAERLERKAGKFTPSEDDEPGDDIEDLYDQLEDAAEAAQVLSRASGASAGWLARCITDRLEKDRERTMEEIEQELKTLCPPREVRNFRVLFVQDACTVRRTSTRTAQLTVWDALKYPVMGVGERHVVTNLRPTSLNAWMGPDEMGAEIYLGCTQQSQWKRMM
ncbi:hypothetical protein C8F01DRAFT_392979 [Mycena amicta]|nr:hypothetical protein C8F01DRAFT_392979 [Mycena amicta]